MYEENITAVSYLCKYSILDDLLKNIINENNTVNVYFDTKNILSALHSEKEQSRLIKSFTSNTDKFIVARTVIIVANHWMRYFKKRNIGCNLFFFDERGNSVYHNSISRKYKINRSLSKQRIESKLLDSTFYEKWYKVYDDNISIVSGIFERLNNLFFIKLKDLESDFIPQLLMKEYFSNSDGTLDLKYVNIIVGNDKDYGQVLDSSNTYQISKNIKEKTFELRSKNNILEKFTKLEFKDEHILKNPKFIPIILSMAGDEADSVFGLSGVGYITAYKYINKLYVDNIITDADYSMEKFINKIESYKKLNESYFTDKITHQIISNKEKLINNYRLTSFDELMDWLSAQSKIKILNQLNKSPCNDTERKRLLSKLCLNENSFNYLF